MVSDIQGLKYAHIITTWTFCNLSILFNSEFAVHPCGMNLIAHLEMTFPVEGADLDDLGDVFDPVGHWLPCLMDN